MTPGPNVTNEMKYTEAIAELKKYRYSVLYSKFDGKWKAFYRHSKVASCSDEAQGWLACLDHYQARHK